MTPDAGVVPAATARPVPRTPPRRPGSVRRSSHVQLQWPPGAVGDPASAFAVRGAVRDVATDAAGRAAVVGAASLACTVQPDRTVTAISADPRPAGLDRLVGRAARSGWRAVAHDVAAAHTPLGSLLDDVPIAVMLSSYGALRQGRIDRTAVTPLLPRMVDVCAGWARDAAPMRSVDAGGGLPLPGLVPVPPVDGGADDPLGTEPRPPLSSGELRRARRLDVVVGPGDRVEVDGVEVEASFRDSWHEPGVGEGVLHEYVLTARLTADLVIVAIEAAPRVLPYDECSLAAASPARLVGLAAGEVARVVPTLSGTSTCTHLNDLLRSLAAVPFLVAAATAGDG